MAETRRVPGTSGKWINREKPLSFSFEGTSYPAFEGDTVASALAASDQVLLSRSFKYHRPRGALTMAGQDANTLVQTAGNPNVLADRINVSNGLEVIGQNYNGTLAKDKDARIGLVARFLPVGFYYRAFFRPRGIWNKWANFFRRKAGLGVIDQDHIPSGFDKKYLFCDILVIGGGLAGMTAAIDAANAGKNVLLVDENPYLGGSLNYSRLDAEGERATRITKQLTDKIAGNTNIQVLTSAVANGWYTDNWVPVIQHQRMFKVRAAHVILASGAIEQPVIFRNNDLPGIMQCTAAQRLIHLYGVQPGKRCVILTGSDLGYATALDLLDAGVSVAAIADMRNEPTESNLVKEVVDRDIDILAGHTVHEARSNRAGDRIGSVDIRRITGQGQCAKSGKIIQCDVLCMSAGFMPCYQLALQAGAELHYDDDASMFEITRLPQNFNLAGSVNGFWTVKGATTDAELAINKIVVSEDDTLVLKSISSVPDRSVNNPNHPWPIFAHPKGKEFVDFDEDLQIADLLNTVDEGYENIQLVKRFSTCGMGPSQGRHSALAAARLVARHTGKTVAQTGVTTARPPFNAELIAHCAGRSFYPARRSSMHNRHEQLGAQWLHAGTWYRPAYYGNPDERETAIRNEVSRVREAAGLVDISTLGGLDIRGPDAAELINRLYTMAFDSLAVGRARYALMTNDAGVVIDDGVACRLSEHYFYVTATTGGVERVYQSLLRWQAQWQLDVDIANVTSAWCGVNLAGPGSRDILQKICELDLSASAFPYMAVREGQVAEIDARILRVGFVGELGFEIHVPQQYGQFLWDTIMEAGQDHGIGPFGIEAQRMLRLEKGHIIIGQDTDAMSNPMELGMHWALSKKKPYYQGRRTIMELQKQPLRRNLIGFVIANPDSPLPEESHLLIHNDKMAGRITSVGWSSTRQQIIGLAHADPALSEPGTKISIRCDDGVTANGEIVTLPFYDPENKRQTL